MAGQSRKWMILMACIWVQAFTGTNFDFSAYSSELKKVLRVSQMQLNYLATASDLGKAFGWSSGFALMYLPLWMVMFIAAFMGVFGYGVQWLLIRRIIIDLPYVLVFLLCLLAGCSICWFNTVCFVLCTQSFPTNRHLAISLTVSFNGVSAALYNLAAKAIDPSSYTLYLLLNALIPLFISFAALIPILRQPIFDKLPSHVNHNDRFIFIIFNIFAVITGFYLLLIPSFSNHAKAFFYGAIGLLILPLGIPGIVYARNWFNATIYPKILVHGSSFLLLDGDDHYNELVGSSHEAILVVPNDDNEIKYSIKGCWDMVIKSDKLEMLEEEHDAKRLLCRIDFWLYYSAYFCGGTIGLVYSNNLGQIAQSLGLESSTYTLITLYSSFSFFGRLLSATPDFLKTRLNLARTGWLAIALVPTPIALLVLSLTETEVALQIGTSLIGLSSGFIFSAAVSVTSELFGPKSVGVNHNILITNIPVGSLVYGLLSALVYDSNEASFRNVCMGRNCYFATFVLWGCISFLGLISTVLLFLRTRQAYERFEHNPISVVSQ